MCYTDNPLHDFWRHEQEQEEQLKKLPKCQCCDEHIQDDYLFVVDDEIFCEECVKYWFRKPVEDFIKD